MRIERICVLIRKFGSITGRVYYGLLKIEWTAVNGYDSLEVGLVAYFFQNSAVQGQQESDSHTFPVRIFF